MYKGKKHTVNRKKVSTELGKPCWCICQLKALGKVNCIWVPLPPPVHPQAQVALQTQQQQQRDHIISGIPLGCYGHCRVFQGSACCFCSTDSIYFMTVIKEQILLHLYIFLGDGHQGRGRRQKLHVVSECLFQDTLILIRVFSFITVGYKQYKISRFHKQGWCKLWEALCWRTVGITKLP